MKASDQRSAVVLGFALFITSIAQASENWPRFRGPTGQGVSSENGLPIRWSGTENVAWKTAIPGDGWSSPIVFGDRIFVTSTTDGGKSCHVICIDRKTGALLWNKMVFEQVPKQKRPDNSYATPTPVTDGTLVYAVFGSGGIAALDYDGKLRWENHEVSFYSEHGLGASPVLAGQLLIMPYDGNSPGPDTLVGFKKPWDGAVLLALDKTTGEVRWRGKRGLSRLGHVTPNLWERDGVMQLVSGAGDAIQGHNALTGELMWNVYSQGEGVTPSIVLGKSLVYTCSGFEQPTIRVVRAGGQGDVTQTHIAWERKEGVPMLASLLYAEPYVYSITEQGIIHCMNATSGEIVWRNRIGGKHSSSPIFADGRIYFLSELEGESVVIEAGGEFKELARNVLGEKCKASMAVSGRNIFIRTERNMLCIGPSPVEPSAGAP